MGDETQQRLLARAPRLLAIMDPVMGRRRVAARPFLPAPPLLPAHTAVTFISIGANCAAALNLRASGRGGAFFPFDWISSTAAGIEAALSDDFARLLTGLVPDTDVVRDAYNFLYWHDFPNARSGGATAPEDVRWVDRAPLRADWEQALPTVRAKYARRVDRFRAALAAAGTRVVLVFVAVPPSPQGGHGAAPALVADDAAPSRTAGEAWAERILALLRARYANGADIRLLMVNSRCGASRMGAWLTAQRAFHWGLCRALFRRRVSAHGTAFHSSLAVPSALTRFV